MNSKEKPSLFWVWARIFVGLVLAYAGLSKLLEPSVYFEAVLLKYGVFSPKWIPWIAKIVPWIEWLLGGFLIIGYAPRITAMATLLLCLGFLVTLGSTRLILSAGGSDCGCFGHSGLHLSLRQIFVIDLLSLVFMLRIVFLKEFPLSLHALLVKRKGTVDDKKHHGKGRT